MQRIKRLDQFLLLNYPNLWITKFHYILPINIALSILIFLFFRILPFSIQSEYPSSIATNLVLLIPIVVVFVIWIIHQARHNVMKSGGEHSSGLDYMRFGVYLLILFSFYCITLAPVLGNFMRVKNAVDKTTILEHQIALREGFTLFNEIENRSYVDTEEDELSNTYNFNTSGYSQPSSMRMSENEIERIVSDFIIAIETIDNKEILFEKNVILQAIRHKTINNSYSDNWRETYTKIEILETNLTTVLGGDKSILGISYYRDPLKFLNDKWYWRMLLIIFSYVSLCILLFKLMHWRTFLFGLVGILANIFVFSILAGITAISGGRDGAISGLIIFLLIINSALFYAGYMQQEKKWYGVVAAISIHFYLPFVFVFLMVLLYSKSHYNSDWYWFKIKFEDILFYGAYIIGLMNIGLFSRFYRNYWYLPHSK
jgi:hypothetical protein